MIDFDALVLAPAFKTFGIEVAYIDGAGHETSPILGIFDEKWTEVVLDHETAMPVATSRPMVAMRVADIGYGRPTLGELFVIQGRCWRVSDPPAPDGKGNVRVPLSLATDADKQRVPNLPSGAP